MVTRRTVLKTGSIMVVGTAGCLGGHLATEDNSTSNNGGFQRWLVDPKTLEQDHYMMRTMKPTQIADYSETFHREDWDSFRDTLVDLFDFARFYPEDLQRITMYHGYSAVFIIQGDFDQERLVENLRRNDYASSQEYGGFDLYVGTGERKSVGIDTDTIVASVTDRRSPVRIVEYVIDASNGDERRYAEVNTDLAALLAASPLGHVTNTLTFDPIERSSIDQGQFRNQVGVAKSYSFREDDSDGEMTLVFLDERDIRTRDIEEWTHRSDEFRNWRDIDISAEGRVATVSGSIPTRDALSGTQSI